MSPFHNGRGSTALVAAPRRDHDDKDHRLRRREIIVTAYNTLPPTVHLPLFAALRPDARRSLSLWLSRPEDDVRLVAGERKILLRRGNVVLRTDVVAFLRALSRFVRSAPSWLAPPHARPRDARWTRAHARGEARTERRGRCGDDWTVRVVKCRVSDKGTNDPAPRTHAAWKRDLNLTAHAGLELPECLLADASVEVRCRGDDRPRFVYCALDALRAWARAPRPAPPAVGWDPSFATDHPGAWDTRGLGEGLPRRPRRGNCDSLRPRPAADLADGPTKLRPVLCECANARAFVNTRTEEKEAERSTRPPSRPTRPRPPFPRWRPVPKEEGAACADLVSSSLRDDAVVDTVDLWVDNLDPHSLSFLRVSVLVVPRNSWAVQQRYFFRRYGVEAIVIDTVTTCRLEDGVDDDKWRVHRARSWREGPWDDFLREGERLADFDGFEDRVAARRLPETRPTVYEVLEWSRKGTVEEEEHAMPTLLWSHDATRPCRSDVAVTRDSLLLATADGVRALNLRDGRSQWHRPTTNDDESILSLSLSPSHDTLALGTDQGRVLFHSACDGTPLSVATVIAPAPDSSRHRFRDRDRVESTAWDGQGRRLAAAAGRAVAEMEWDENGRRATVVRVREHAPTTAAGAVTGTVTALVADGDDGTLAGAYGGVRSLRRYSSPPPLVVGATATAAVAVSPDGAVVAVGCLDARLRLFHRDDGRPPVDWVGFDGPVRALAFSGRRLAAAGGSALLVVSWSSSDVSSNEGPIRCARDDDDGGRVGALAWSPRGTRLAAIVEGPDRNPTARACLFGVDDACVDGSVPRAARPLFEAEIPAGRGGSDEGAVRLVETAGDADDDHHNKVLTMVVVRGSRIDAYAVPRRWWES